MKTTQEIKNRIEELELLLFYSDRVTMLLDIKIKAMIELIILYNELKERK
jgi:hypothetical protein